MLDVKTDASPLLRTPDWYKSATRWTQLTLAEDDPVKFDPAFWIDVFKRTKSNATCLSAGGYIAYYPSKVPLHYVSKFIGDSDPFGTLVEGARRLLAETCAGLGEKFPDVALTAELVHFTNPEELIEGATDAALVVVGHHPASRIHRILYRSVSAAILEHASVPVAVVPTDPS